MVRAASLTEQRHSDRFKLVEPPTSYSSDEEDFVDARENVVQSDQEERFCIGFEIEKRKELLQWRYCEPNSSA